MSFLDDSNGAVDPTQNSHAPQEAKRSRGAGPLVAKIRLANAVADEMLPKMSHAELAVWLLLWRDAKNGITRSSQEDLARRAGVHVGTVPRAIGGLRRHGLIRVIKRGGLRQGPSEYELVDPLQDSAGAILTTADKVAPALPCNDSQPSAARRALASAGARHPSRDIQVDATDARRLGAAASVGLGEERGSQ